VVISLAKTPNQAGAQFRGIRTLRHGHLLLIRFQGRRSLKCIKGLRIFLRFDYGLTGELRRFSATFDDLLFRSTKLAKPATFRERL
jgi:hypothetical protein